MAQRRTKEQETRVERKVLVISYNYPPVGTIGSLRVTQLVRRLPGLGWRPTVITVLRDITKPSGWDEADGIFTGVKTLRAPFPDPLTRLRVVLHRAGLLGKRGYQGKKRNREREKPEKRSNGLIKGIATRLVGWAAKWGTFPDRYILWTPFALLLALKEVKSSEYDLIFSTSPPLSNHLVALLLSTITSIPWVADLRDPWAHGYLELTGSLKVAHAWLERAVLTRASSIVAVYRPLAEEIEKHCSLEPGTVHFISNGFDPDEYPEAARSDSGKFIITFAGSVFGLKQDPTPLMSVIEDLISEGKLSPDEIVVRFFGPPDAELFELRESLKYPETMEIHGVFRRREVLEREVESAALLVLLWDNPYTAKYYGGKVYEYLGAKRPVLAWSPAGGEIGLFLEKTGAGVAVSGREELRNVLIEWISEFRRTGRLEYRGKEQEIRKYTWEEKARQMAKVFEYAVGYSRRASRTDHPGGR